MKISFWFIISVLFALNVAMGTSLLRVSSELELHVLDVGQGDAILIITPEQHHILVDGGPGRSVLSEIGEVLPHLFNEIDLLVLTHPHSDHMEGLIPVLERFEVGAVLMSAPEYGSEVYSAFLDELDGRAVYFAEAGMDFELGSVKLDVLFPFESFTGEELGNINNVSPIIMLEFEEIRILLTGDAEQEIEAELLDLDVRADILKAGHHGSRTSSSLEFLEAVNPELLLISAGVDNSYDHPHPETLEKAADLDVQVLRTDLEGRISLIFADQGWLRSILAPRLRSFSSKRS